MPFDNANIPESQRTANLKAARGLIARPDQWIANVLSYHGRYCALGALQKVGVNICGVGAPEILLLAARARPGAHAGSVHYTTPEPRIADHNNTYGHAATVELFDAAIVDSIELDTIAALA